MSTHKNQLIVAREKVIPDSYLKKNRIALLKQSEWDSYVKELESGKARGGF